MSKNVHSIYHYPEYYEITSPGCPGDVEFYVQETRKFGEPILEVGCGLGRIMIHIAKAGLKIIGIDNSVSMLSTVQKRIKCLTDEEKNNISLIKTDIRSPDIKEKFKTVIIPYRTFLHLYSIEEQMAALSAIHTLLSKNGKLIFNIFDPDLETLAQFTRQIPATQRILRKGKLPHTQKSLISWAATSCDPNQQIIEELWTYEELKNDELITRKYGIFKIRYIFRYEMEHLLSRAGFKIENLFGDFDYSPYQYSREQIWICTKK